MNNFTLSEETAGCLERLDKFLSGYGSAAIAFSGGIDSTLLLEAATRIKGSHFFPIIVRSVLNPESEISAAVDFLRNGQYDYVLLEADILDDTAIASNPADRCYHCKKFIFSRIISAAAERGVSTVFDGSHSEDLHDYRPGLKALSDLGVMSPLKEAGFSKSNIRELARFYNLLNWNAEASPCLATRIPYGTAINRDTLLKIEMGEAYLKQAGFTRVRLRAHGDIARIEIPAARIEELASPPLRGKVTEYIKSLGFSFVAIDLDGYRTGSMNIDILRDRNLG